MSYQYDEASLTDTHLSNQEQFRKAEADMDDMQQTLSRETERLNQWLDRLCQSEPDIVSQTKRALDNEDELLQQQISQETETLAQVQIQEAGHYQNLSDLLNLL